MSEKKRFRFTIFQKLWLAMVIASIVPLASVWYVTRLEILSDVNHSVAQELSAAAQRLRAEVDNWIDINRRAMAENAGLAGMVSMDPTLQNPILKRMAKTYDWAYLVYTTAPSGSNIGRNDDEKTRYYGDRWYFKQVMAGNPFVHQVVIGKTSGQPTLILARPILGDEGQTVGVLGMAMTLDKLSQTITTLHIGKTGFAFLLDDEGKVIAHPHADLAQHRVDFSNHPAFLKTPNQNGDLVTYMRDGIRRVAYSLSTADGWDVVVQQNYDEAFAPVRAADRHALYLLGITLVLASLLAYLLSQRLSRPIAELTEVADKISRGQLDAKVPGIERSDEIGALARAIGRMGTSIQLAIKKLSSKTR